MKNPKFLSLIVLIFALTACNRVAHKNTNQTFNKFKPSSLEYKQELAEEIQTSRPGELKFIFNDYLKINGKEYLNINVQGDELDASGVVLVNNWTKLEGLKKTLGIGYRGAELKNLKMDITYQDSEPVLIYKDIDKIVD